MPGSPLAMPGRQALALKWRRALQGGSTPSAAAFLRTCAALNGPGTCCYVALEQRASAVMRAFHASAAAEGFRLVMTLSLSK